MRLSFHDYHGAVPALLAAAIGDTVELRVTVRVAGARAEVHEVTQFRFGNSGPSSRQFDLVGNVMEVIVDEVQA
jgi:hypothetical protein